MVRLRPTTPLGKIMKCYSERSGVPVVTLRFLFDGIKIKETDTPKSLDMSEVS